MAGRRVAFVFLGTSNCIVADSCVDAVRSIAAEEVINASVGASASRLGLYMLPQVKLAKGDVVFLDYTITDSYYLPYNTYVDDLTPYYNTNPEAIRLDLLSIVDYLLQAECHPVLIVHPTTASLNGELKYEDIHTDICRAFGIPIFNVSNLLRRVLARGRAIDVLMRDDTHQTPAVTAVVGRAMVEIADKVRALGRTIDLAGQPVWLPRAIQVAPSVDPSRRIAFSSRLRSSEMALVRQGEAIELDVGPEEAVLGLVVNMAGPGARIRLKGSDGEEVRDLIYDWANDDLSVFMSIFVALRRPIEGGPDGVILEVLAQDGLTTPPEIFRPPVLDQPAYDVIAVEGVLVATKSIARTVNTGAAPAAHDLLEDRYEALAEELYRATDPERLIQPEPDFGELELRLETALEVEAQAEPRFPVEPESLVEAETPLDTPDQIMQDSRTSAQLDEPEDIAPGFFPVDYGAAASPRASAGWLSALTRLFGG